MRTGRWPSRDYNTPSDQSCANGSRAIRDLFRSNRSMDGSLTLSLSRQPLTLAESIVMRFPCFVIRWILGWSFCVNQLVVWRWLFIIWATRENERLCFGSPFDDMVRLRECRYESARWFMGIRFSVQLLVHNSNFPLSYSVLTQSIPESWCARKQKLQFQVLPSFAFLFRSQSFLPFTDKTTQKIKATTINNDHNIKRAQVRRSLSAVDPFPTYFTRKVIKSWTNQQRRVVAELRRRAKKTRKLLCKATRSSRRRIASRGR